MNQLSAVQRANGCPHGVPFGEAVRVWARIAALSFGGPAGQIAVMHRILVEEKRWIGENRFLHALNYCMLLPGPGGAAARRLHRLAAAQDARRAGRRHALRPARLRRASWRLSWIYAAFGNVGVVAGPVLRPQGGGAGDRARGGGPDRPARAQEPRHGRRSPRQPSSRIFSFDVPFPLDHPRGRR